jgi:hypothetical protein
MQNRSDGADHAAILLEGVLSRMSDGTISDRALLREVLALLLGLRSQPQARRLLGQATFLRVLDHQGESAELPLGVSRPIDAPQEVLGLLARRRPSGITDLSRAAQGRSGASIPWVASLPMWRLTANEQVIHSSAELSYSQVRARAPIDPRGV